jgi:hypothetical protein
MITIVALGPIFVYLDEMNGDVYVTTVWSQGRRVGYHSMITYSLDKPLPSTNTFPKRILIHSLLLAQREYFSMYSITFLAFVLQPIILLLRGLTRSIGEFEMD